MKKTLLSFIALLACCSASFGQAWERYYMPGTVGLYASDQFYDPSMGGVILGWSTDFSTPPYTTNIYLMRFNTQGDSLWRITQQSQVGMFDYNGLFQAASLTMGGNAVVGGYEDLADASGTGHKSYMLTKYSATGSPLLSKEIFLHADSLQDADDNQYSSLNRYGDGFLLVMGYPEALNYGNPGFYDSVKDYSVYYKLDSNFNILWVDTAEVYTHIESTSNIADPHVCVMPQSTCITSDGGFAVIKNYDTASDGTLGGGTWDFVKSVLIAYDANGNQKWLRNLCPTIGIGHQSIYPNLIATSDSGLVAYGRPYDTANYFYQTYQHDSYILHFSKNGAVVDSLKIDGSADHKQLVEGFKAGPDKLMFFIADSFSHYSMVTFDEHLNYQSAIPDFDNTYFGFSKVSSNGIGGGVTAYVNTTNGALTGFLRLRSFDSLGNTYPSIVSGNLNYDLNSNCTVDAGEPVFTNRLVNLYGSDNHQYFSFSNNSGHYRQPVSVSPISVGTGTDGNKEIVCPTTGVLPVAVTGPGTYNGNDFYEHLIPNLTNLATYIYGTGFIAGYEGTIYATTVNKGSVPVTTILQITVDPTLAIDSVVPAATSVAGNVYSFAVTALQADSAIHVRIYATTPVAALGSQLSVTADLPVTGDMHPADNTDTFSNIVLGSYDPNEKSVNRPLHFNGSRELVYNVQFQNTGTYPAKNIVVVDTIDSHLDMSTFKFIAANPAMPVISWHEGNVLFFSFPSIYLADSNSNEAASHGSFAYSIEAKNSDQIGDSIRNTAYIYFDYNSPVVTNTTLNILTAVPTAVRDAAATIAAVVYPNPNSGAFTVQVPQTGNYTITVSDLAGKQVWMHQFNNATGNLPVKLSAPTGMYLLHVTDSNTGKGMTQKIVVQ